MNVNTFDLRIFEVLGIVFALIFLDFLIGVIKALASGTFNIQKLPGQLPALILTYFLPLAGVAVVVFFSPILNIATVSGWSSGAYYAYAAGVGLKVLSDIALKIGVPLPAVLGGPPAAPATVVAAQGRPPGARAA